MVISNIQGGLGNQISQWAHGKSFSLRNNTDFFVNLDFYKSQSGNTYRDFGLKKFPFISLEIDGGIDKSNFLGITDNFFYQEIKYNHLTNYNFSGYWHTEKYFSDFRDEILAQLRPGDQQTERISGIIPQGGISVSIHVRRTDYLKNPDFHPVQDVDYYSRALEIIGKYDCLLIFSDDIKWCRENFNFARMIFVEGLDDIDDLWLMSMCSHNIIANSTFSWWGAWLNQNEGKIVISPSRWLGPAAGINESDIIPDGWIKI